MKTTPPLYTRHLTNDVQTATYWKYRVVLSKDYEAQQCWVGVGADQNNDEETLNWG